MSTQKSTLGSAQPTSSSVEETVSGGASSVEETVSGGASSVEGRVDIWRDQCDRWSRKFFCQLRKFLEKQRKMLNNLTPNDLINA